jgi:hypothetical protein
VIAANIGAGGSFFIEFSIGGALLGDDATIAGWAVAGSAAMGGVIGTIATAPQRHLAFLPAMAGFQRNVLPH